MKRLKPQVLPYDNCNIDDLAQCLHDAKLVHRYVIDGKGYIQIIQFSKHQQPHIKEQASTIPAPDMHCSCTEKVNPHPEHAALIPSLLIPDSFNPSTTLSGLPDDNAVLKAQAIEVLDYLNHNTKRSYRPVDANIKLIMARLKSGATPKQCREVIFNKCGEWADDEKMAEYLRPATLFNATKFEQYIGELNAMS